MQNQRKTVVVMPELQYQEAVFTVAVMLLTINMVIIVGSLFPSTTGISVKFSTAQILYLGLFEGLILLVAWRKSLKDSHKMVGPVYAFSRELAKLAGGDLTAKVILRPGDAFHETAKQINLGLDSLKSRITTVKSIARALSETKDNSELTSLTQQLNSELDGLITEYGEPSETKNS